MCLLQWEVWEMQQVESFVIISIFQGTSVQGHVPPPLRQELPPSRDASDFRSRCAWAGLGPC